MALLIDGCINQLEDLRAQDSSVLQVGSDERIDLPAKLRLAEDEIRSSLEQFLREESECRLGQVLVTEPLKRWHRLRTLDLAYRDAYFSQLNDRYGSRWKEYAREAAAAKRDYFDGGVGIVVMPLRRPDAPSVEITAGSAAAASYWIQATAAGPGFVESAPSMITAVQADPNHSLTVRVNGLAAEAYGWNVYAGYAIGEITLQTPAPLAPGQPWTLPVDGLTPTGRKPGLGQDADRFVTRTRLLRRG
jgi:hypothetical protein